MGAGLMGAGLTVVFGAAGHGVTVVEVDPHCRETLRARVAALTQPLAAAGLMTTQAAATLVQRFSLESELQAALEGPVLLAVEAVGEELELKRRVMRQLDAGTPADTLLGTNTSGLSITAIAEGLRHPGRVCGTHFWNPPHLIPLVEVVFGRQTAEQTVARMADLLAAAGKRPVVVRQDLPGFIGNRLLHALQKEAMSLVARGVATAADVDLVVTHGFGRRLGVVGPLAVCDLAGLDLVLEVDAYLLRDLDRSPEPSPLLTRLVNEGHLGAKTGHGFHSWSEDQLRETTTGRDAALIEASLRDTDPRPAGRPDTEAG